jgi:hypothetical protein
VTNESSKFISSDDRPLTTKETASSCMKIQIKRKNKCFVDKLKIKNK